MQLTGFRIEFAKARWGLDMIVCIAAAVSLHLLITIWTFPFETSPLDVSQLLAKVVSIIVAYVLSSVLGIWVLRIHARSFVWTAVAGTITYAILEVALILPRAIEYHGRFGVDSSLIGYLLRNSIPPFILILILFGGVTLIVSSFVRILWVSLRSHDQKGT